MILIDRVLNNIVNSLNHELFLPPVKPEDNICLPLSVKVVSKYWNVDLPLSEGVQIAKKYQNVRGSILIEGIELAQRHGLKTVILNSSIKELKKIIDKEIPPIVILPGIYETIQHASVISGYDEVEKTIFHYVPEPDQIGVIPENKFDKLWSEDNRTALLIAPPNEISSIKPNDENMDKSNKLCFFAERLNLLKKSVEAIDNLKEALSINSKNVTALSLLAGILNEQNSPTCIQYYEKSIELNKNCYLAFRGLGNYYLKTKQFPKAEKNYDHAININSTRFGPIYKNRGIVKLEQNKKNEAAKDFQEYLKQTPNAKDKTQIQNAIKEL